ncbi:MAG: PEP-CTERM sorting domain-containing protein [Alphaproteobacteria bacterium]|nr:PEP-CTERM sorting domain-containing protein [Alphaproteobacteria bacterium]
MFLTSCHASCIMMVYEAMRIGRAGRGLTWDLALSGLEVGRNYVLQLMFSNDENITGNNVDITIEGATHRLDDWQPDAINLTAEFTASSSTVLVTFSGPLDGPTGSARRAIVNAYALHLLPEPGAMAIFVLGLAGLAFARRRLVA